MIPFKKPLTALCGGGAVWKTVSSGIQYKQGLFFLSFILISRGRLPSALAAVSRLDSSAVITHKALGSRKFVRLQK